MNMRRSPSHGIDQPRRLGWLEVIVAAIVYFIGVVIIGLWVSQMSADRADLRGIVEMAANGAAGTAAILAAFAIRIRDVRSFGFIRVERRWLALGAALGIAGFFASFGIEHVYYLFVDEAPIQGNYQAAAKGGAMSLLVILVTGAILTPMGEEFVFRAILANVLNRYGLFIGVVGSAAIFGLAHGLNVILLDAFMIGIFTGALFRRTGSIWPGLVVHMTYNALHLLAYSVI